MLAIPVGGFIVGGETFFKTIIGVGNDHNKVVLRKRLNIVTDVTVELVNSNV